MSLSLSPQIINEDAWYYEESDGLHIMHRCCDAGGNFVGTSEVVVPWDMIRVSIRRKDKKKLPRVRRVR